jgi:catalase
MVRNAYTLHRDEDDFGQPRCARPDVMDDTARDRLVSNVSGHLWNGVVEPVLTRAIYHWRNVDADLGARVAANLGFAQPVARRSVA